MLNIAIYGMGSWGSRLIDSVQGKSNKIKFVCGISRDAAKHRAAAGKYGLTLTSNYADVLKDPAVDAVLIATPHSMHCQHRRRRGSKARLHGAAGGGGQRHRCD